MNRKILAAVLAASYIAGQPFGVLADEMPESAQDTRTRLIITTDGECDDYDSLHHILLYANDLDIDGIVYSASAFHFQGDGGTHTLGDVTEDFLCTAENAADLTSYRPQEMGWIEKTISEEYAVDYEYLVQNDPNFPSPEELLSVVKVGNVEFEGDVREPSEGSELIRQCIMDDDDERTLYIETWGGFNTVARALLSIYEEYGETEEWPDVYRRITEKVVLQGIAQDTTYKNYIQEIYPDLKVLEGTVNCMGYFSADRAPAHAIQYFNSEWLTENIKFDHGALMSAYYLVGDGAYYEGEIDLYQFGQRTKIGFSEESQFQFDQYDWLGEGDSAEWIPLIPVGLRGLENPNYGTWGGRLFVNKEAKNRAGDYDEYSYVDGKYGWFSGNRWLEPYFEDWAARADWAVGTYEECNHAPIVTAAAKDLSAKAGETVQLEATAEDPDGDDLSLEWWVYEEASEYSGEADGLRVWYEDKPVTSFTVPQDAQPGDYFNIILKVKDCADAPMTRYAQIIVTVTE